MELHKTLSHPPLAATLPRSAALLSSPILAFHDLLFPDSFHWTGLVLQPIPYPCAPTESSVDKQTSFKALWAITYPFIKIAVLKVILISFFFFFLCFLVDQSRILKRLVWLQATVWQWEAPQAPLPCCGGISLRPGRWFPASFEKWGAGAGWWAADKLSLGPNKR